MRNWVLQEQTRQKGINFGFGKPQMVDFHGWYIIDKYIYIYIYIYIHPASEELFMVKQIQ